MVAGLAVAEDFSKDHRGDWLLCGIAPAGTHLR